MKLADQPWFLVVLGAVATTVMGVVGFIAQNRVSLWMGRKKRSKRLKRFAQGIKSIKKVFDGIEYLKKMPEVDMVFFVEIGNGGAPPMAGSKIYGTTILMSLADGVDSNTTELEYEVDYERFKIDAHYISLSMRLLEDDDPIIYDAERETANTFIKRVTIKHEIKCLMYHHIYADLDGWRQFILGLGTFGEHKFDDVHALALIGSTVEQIRTAMEDARNQL